jgi:hypothetical protein
MQNWKSKEHLANSLSIFAGSFKGDSGCIYLFRGCTQHLLNIPVIKTQEKGQTSPVLMNSPGWHGIGCLHSQLEYSIVGLLNIIE